MELNLRHRGPYWNSNPCIFKQRIVERITNRVLPLGYSYITSLIKRWDLIREEEEVGRFVRVEIPSSNLRWSKNFQRGRT